MTETTLLRGILDLSDDEIALQVAFIARTCRQNALLQPPATDYAKGPYGRWLDRVEGLLGSPKGGCRCF
jgi:hypothetical protein